MTNDAASVVAKYVSSLNLGGRDYAYFGLDDENCIETVGGAIDIFGFVNLEAGKRAETQLPFLEGLLPGDKRPIIISNTQYRDDQFVDLHLFLNEGRQWLVFVDNTDEAIELQKAQQVRLNEDIATEKRVKSITDHRNKTAFLLASEQMYKLLSDFSCNTDEKISNILKIGLNIFQLDTAIINLISGDTYKIVSIESKVETSFSAGSEFSSIEMPCATLLKNNFQFAINNISNSNFNNSPWHKASGIESYIGSQIQTINGPFGTISFSSLKQRATKFTDDDYQFLLMLVGLIGSVLGEREKLELVEAQSQSYKNLFDSVPAMMFLCDMDGLVISVSEYFSQQMGMAQDEMPGKMCHTYFSLNDKNSIKASIRDGDAEHVPAVLNRFDAGELEVELNVKVKSIGAMSGIRMVIATDVTERNKAMREVTEQNRLLASANESLDQFAYVASHDLQEPLRKIQQFSRFLEEDLGDNLNEDSRYHMEVIVKASQRMSGLIKDLLDFSRTKQSGLESSEVNLNDLIQNVISELDRPIKGRHAIISVDELPVVQGNAAMLTQMFANLIGNSIKYTAASVRPEISIKLQRDEEQDSIYIKDNGIGFDMEYASQIFDPFNRLHNSKEYEGTGIGLAICRAVCEKHRWQISAFSELGSGSTFCIEITNDRSTFT